MSEWAIRADGLGKQYALERTAQRTTLAESAVNAAKALCNPAHWRAGRTDDAFWALQDATFEIAQGERVGLIGPNGAGKSTLLKLLSRVTVPTVGRASVRGRLSSLLEVGTGFHPELTGRENVYLNGSLLGMSRADIRRRFDTIVDFAGVGEFIDEPVKHYSSGMQLRLAFSVAAHLDSDILFLDEVLAVGDIKFQKRCMGKINEIANDGRTILYVSHNLQGLANLCGRAMVFEHGRIIGDGPTGDIIDDYVERSRGGRLSFAHAVSFADDGTAPGNDVVRLLGVRAMQNGETVKDAVRLGADLDLEITYRNLKPDVQLRVGLRFFDRYGTPVFSSDNFYLAENQDDCANRPSEPGLYTSVCRIPAKYLNDIKYFVTVMILDGANDLMVRADEVISLDVTDDTSLPQKIPGFQGPLFGVVRQHLTWHTEKNG